MDNSFETLLEHSKQAIRYWWLLLLTGIALFIIGLVVFLYPAQSYLGMSLMFGFLIFFSGLFQIILSAGNKHYMTGRGWMLAGGIIEVMVSPIVEALPGEHKEKAMSLLHSFYCWGHVAVVLLTGNYDSEAHTIAVCEQVEHYLRALCDSRLAREGLHVLPAMVMTVNVTASVEVDAPDNAAQAERGAQECLQALLDPFCAERGENPIGALPGLTDLYAALRRVPHILAVRDVLLEGSYYDYNRSRVVALDVGSSYPFAVPRSGRHVLRI